MSGFVLQSILTTDETGFVLDSIEASQAIAVVGDIDGANVDAATTSVSDPESETPAIDIAIRSDVGSWRQVMFALDNAEGKSPTIRLPRSSAAGTGAYGTNYRPMWTQDFKTYVRAPSRSVSASWVTFSFSDPLPAGRVYIVTHPMGRQTDAEEFATELLVDHSAVAAPGVSADANGVFYTSPAENDVNGRPVGSNPMHAIRLNWGGATTDGGPKRHLAMCANIHAQGESVSFFCMRAGVNWMLNDQSEAAQRFRSNVVVSLYFHLNPNGVYAGAERLIPRLGIDPNRQWNNNNAEEINATRTAIEADLADIGRLDCFMSWHGDVFRTTPYIVYTSEPQTGHAETAAFLAIGEGPEYFNTAVTRDVFTAATSPTTDVHYGFATLGATVAFSNEIQGRGDTDPAGYEQVGTNWIRMFAEADAQGLFYQTEVSLAAVESGEDAFAFSASVQVETRLQAAEAGADTAAMAASGLVGVQAAATEQGSDSTAMAASLVTAASLAVTEAGLDVAGLQVEAPIAATLAGAEQGADAYSGQVTTLNALSVQLQATESGQDQFQGIAAVAVQGALLAQETGQDSYQGSVAVPVQADLAAQEVGADVYSGAASVDEEPVLDGVLAALSTTETGVDVAGFSIRSDILVKAGALEAGADALEMQAQLSVQAALNALEEGEDEYRSVTDMVEVYRVKFKVNLPDAVGYTVDIPDRQRFDIRVM